MSTYLVTGGAGFIGSHLVESLLADGHSVRILDNLVTGKRENISSGATLIEGDVGYAEVVKSAANGVYGIFHLAAIPSVPLSVEDPVGTFRTNVMGTLHVLDAARLAGVKRVVATSSSAIYGDQLIPHSTDAVARPMSPYGVHKFMGEKWASMFSSIYGLQTVSLRHFNVYGPRMADTGAYASVINIFLNLHRKGLPLTIIGDGEQTRDFVHVSDVVRAYKAAMTNESIGKGEVFNVGTGQGRTVNQIAALIGGTVEHLPPRKGDILHSVADVSKTKELLGWEAKKSFEEGLRDLLRQYGMDSGE
ncbi:MAG: NAD-dependent epimerase/dehydratase family protein [Patescibacteria group bacterium]